MQALVDTERARVTAWREHPALTRPEQALLGPHQAVLDQARRDARRALTARLDRDRVHVSHVRAQMRALSPAATLERGYAVVQHSDRSVVRTPDDVSPGEVLRVLLATGEITAQVMPASESAE